MAIGPRRFVDAILQRSLEGFLKLLHSKMVLRIVKEGAFRANIERKLCSIFGDGHSAMSKTLADAELPIDVCITVRQIRHSNRRSDQGCDDFSNDVPTERR